MEELQVNMLGSPHSDGLAPLHCLLSKMAFLCAACWCRAARGVFGGSYPPWVRRSAHCKPPNTEQQQSHWWRGVAATSGAASLPPASIPPSGVRPAQANNQLGWTVTVWLPSWGERVKKSGIRDKQKVLD